MSGLLSNAISGLQASQVALRTAGNNISNANTAGYSRQTVNFSSRPEQQFGGAGFLGNGVNTDSVARVVNDFVTNQLRLDTSAFNQLDKFNTNIGKVDSLFADDSTGLVGAMQDFFSALQNSASDPSSVPARQLVITQISSISTRFNTLYSRLDDIENSVDGEVKTVTAQISSIAKSIADLNQAIATKNASGSGSSPNDLLDQRDEAIRKLSELTSVQLVKQDGGDVNVFIGNGEPLVVGPKVSNFSVDNTGKIFISNNVSSSEVTDEITGGQLGGLLQFKKEVLEPAFNSLGRVAVAMSDAFNKAQAQGLDLNGNYGGPIFSDINQKNITYSRVIHGNNAQPDDRQISLDIEDPSKITTSDYKFSVTPNSSNYTITRLSDNATVGQGILPGSYPESIEFDGLKLNLEGGSFQGGDTFTLQPTHTGARDIDAAITQPALLAYAVPIRTGSSSGNMGNASISSGEILSMTDINKNPLAAFASPGKLTPPVVIHFTSDTTYEVLDNTDPLNPKPLDPPIREQTFYPNRENAIFSTDIGETKIVGNGSRLGLPAGRTAIPSALLPTPVYANSPAQPNGYPVEQYTFTTTDPTTGLVTNKIVTATSANASAAQTAAQLSMIPGVTANAFTTANITDINIDKTGFTWPLQISLNGENLITYNGANIDSSVPDPTDGTKATEVAFNDYLADKINSNANLKALGIRAESGSNAVTGAPEIHLVASSGVNLDVRLTAANTPGNINNISVNDGTGNPNVRLNGQNVGGSEQSAVTVGGRVDLTLANGVKLATAPTISQIFGDSSAPDFAKSSYMGYQVKISGQPKAGDTFTVDFNTDSKNDNRNGLLMTGLETKGTMDDGSMSFGQGYGRLVEDVGTRSNLSKINTDASKSLLQQTQSMRDGVSGVNMDEEAANLIQFQQLYTANARVITVSKDLFDTLLQSVR